MITMEEKGKLIKGIEKANDILGKYGLKLNYDQYTPDNSRPLEPGLFIYTGDKCNTDLVRSITITTEVPKKADESGKKMLEFYVGAIQYSTSNLKEGKKRLKNVETAIADCKKLNDIGLWVSDELVSLYS